MKGVLVIIFVIGTVSCGTENVYPKTVDLEKFTIQVPATWTATKQQGYDSFVGQINVNDKENINFDFGRYSSKLTVDPTTHDIDFMVIDNKTAKIVKPKNFGRGTTGVYFDSLETTKTSKFQISGTELSPDSQRSFLTALKSLKFKN
jgi:hypothetical protein